MQHVASTEFAADCLTADRGVLTAAVAAVALDVTDEVKALAAQQLETWFDIRCFRWLETT